MTENLDMSLAGVMENSQCNQHSQDLLKKFQWAIKRVTNENCTDNEDSTQLTQDELIQLIRSWEPQRDIICLYVRWARQLRRNFNLDSIATLLCLSRQCDYTPVNFLRKVKTLTVHKHHKALYGVTFLFDIPNRKDIKNRDRLNKEFLGLSVTLALLQEQVTESPSILGKTRMRQSGPRTAYRMNIPIIDENSDQHASLVTHPTIEFHTQSSLLNRIWISINHRWLALYFTEHLFREAEVPWSYHDALVFSFQMMAPCGPGRFEFLSPLAGFCFRFNTQESIESKRTRLRQIRIDPSSFLSYGNSCLTQFSVEAKSRIITACFEELRSEISTNSKQISYNRDCSWLRRWTMLRAYIFHFWLESSSNSLLKSMVTNQASTNVTRKKRKIDASPDKMIGISNIHSSSVSTKTKVQRTSLKVPPEPFSNGLHSITSSRRTSNLKSTTTCEDNQAAEIVGGKVLAITDDNSNLAPTVINDIVSGSSMKDTNWTSLRLITSEEMQQFVQSFLVIHRTDGVDILGELSPLEVYSADHLHDWSHCRTSGKCPFFPTETTGHVTFHIRTEADCFIDRYAKSYHVSRERSEYFLEHADVLPALPQIQVLCQAVVSHGTIDSKRAMGQYRVNIGNGGQNWVNGAPCKLHGLQFEKGIEDEGSINAAEVLLTIGQITEFTWRVICSLQIDANDHTIAPDSFRKQLYAERLNEYLNMDKEVGFEDITLVVSSLHPVMHQVLEHRDTMNDTLAGYTRTAAFNMVMIDDRDELPTILHLQVICNFRKVIGHYVAPFHKYLAPVAEHARQYLEKWDHNIRSVYVGKTTTIPTAFDRSSFFLDDTLQYTVIPISEEGKHKQTISAEYILTEINVSRTFSLSMFIDPIVKLQRHLHFDQMMELAFACSFLSNPFWFDWSMCSLIRRLEDPNEPFVFGLHPFYDWSHQTIEIFGGWQGGPFNRWSPCGGKETILDTFGAHEGATKEERALGESRLSQVIAILYEHVEWINSMTNCGHMPVVDMPLSSMKAICNKTIKAIAKIASCQFSHFRLGIFTTILSGCGLLKEGKHLRNLMYPVKGSASIKHLGCPVGDIMSTERARALGDNKANESISNDGEGVVNEEHHDLFMQYLSSKLGFTVYVRDEIECILCESHPMRSLNCRDWFRKGMTIYDCNTNGEFFFREYGRNTKWVKLCPPQQYEFAYLGKPSIHYIPLDCDLSYLALDFGVELRDEESKKVKFKGRNSRTSSHQRTFANNYSTTKEVFCRPSMQTADFYRGSTAKRNKLRSMFVLEDAEHAVDIASCNNLDSYPRGKYLHNYLRSLPILANNPMSSMMEAGCYHMDSESNCSEVTFFPGHLDKPFVHTAWFVPIGDSPFFTILSVSRTWTCVQES